MTPHRPLELLDAQRRARLHDQARRHAQQLRREAFGTLWRGLVSRLQRALGTRRRPGLTPEV